MQLYIKQLPQTEQIVLAGDHTAWPRVDAKTLKERTFEHQAQPMSGAKPVTIGQGYSTVAIIPESEGSWANPSVLHYGWFGSVRASRNYLQEARQYLRRFAIDHWYRFAKQRLHWTLPKLGTREQCERWSDLMPLLTW